MRLQCATALHSDTFILTSRRARTGKWSRFASRFEADRRLEGFSEPGRRRSMWKTRRRGGPNAPLQYSIRNGWLYPPFQMHMNYISSVFLFLCFSFEVTPTQTGPWCLLLGNSKPDTLMRHWLHFRVNKHATRNFIFGTATPVLLINSIDR